MAATSGAPPAPVAVVSPQFCAPNVVPLTVTKKAFSFSGGDFTVTDADGAVVLQVQGTFFSVRNRRVILDPTGQPILSMQEKDKKTIMMSELCNRSKVNMLISIYVKKITGWKVFRGDSTKASDLLFSAKRTSIFQLKTKMAIFLAGNTSEEVCDFKIKGSYSKRTCTFYLGNSDTMIAQMKRKYTFSNVLLGKDTFTVTVFPNVDYVFIAALVVMLDEIHSHRRRRRSSHE